MDSLVSIQWPGIEWDVAENSIDVFCCDVAVFIEIIPIMIVLNFSTYDKGFTQAVAIKIILTF